MTVMQTMNFGWLISGENCAAQVVGVDNGGDYACIGAGSLLEIFVPLAQFCCESKTIKSYI